MHIPVVDSGGVPLMPCHPAKARLLCKSGKARPKRNKLGLFYVQLYHAVESDNQPQAAGSDPGSKFEGFSVVGTVDTVLNLMVEAPDHVKEAVKMRRTIRRARRFRRWRRPKRFDTVGSFDRQKQTISLNEYRTNKRLTQGAKVEKCRVLTWVAFRAFLVGKTATSERKKAGKGKKPPIPTSLKGGPVSSRRVNSDGSPQADN